MRLYIDHGNLDILNNSYKDLKKSIEKDSERGIYSLFDCLFDYTNKYSYTIYDNNQFEEILELALGSYSQKKYHNKNNNINNNEDLESEVYKLIVKTFTVDISPKEFMKSFERSIKRLFAIDASDKNISLTVVDTVHLYEKIIKFSFIDSDDTDSIISNYELNDIPIIQTIDKLQCVIALKEFLENIYSHFRNEKNTNNNLIRHLTDYSNLLEEYTDVMNPGDDQQAQQNYDVERKIREIHQKIKMEKDKCRWMTSDDQLQFGNLYRLDYYLLNENTILSDEILEKEKKIHYIAYRNINKTLKERTDFASNYSPKTNYQSILNLFNHLIPFLGNKLNEEKIEQNNKIYADVSHRIKNIIQSIQTPLLDILDWAEKKQSIKNVVKGTQIISDMVNLSSHSYSASIEDFIYDANNNSNKISIESLIIDSIKKVIPNMFDGKHFNNETRNYFTKKEHEIARKEFADKIENSNELDTIINYLERYFFKTKIDITNSADKKIGNDRNSETKLAIIFVELILNAFKNASYVDKSKRIFSLSTKFDENFTFSISNSYLQKRTIKTTGFGLDSVNRMLISLNGRLAIEKNKIYNTDLIILNIWEGS